MLRPLFHVQHYSKTFDESIYELVLNTQRKSKCPICFSRHGVHHAPLLSVYMVIIRYRPLHRMAPYYTGLNNTKTVWRLHFMFDKKIDWYWMPCLNYKGTPFINILDPFCDDTIYHNKICHVSLYAL